MKVKKFQEGGAAPAPQEGMEPQGGGAGMEEQLAQMAQQVIQEMGPEAAAMLAEMIMQMLQGAAAEQQGQPAYQRKGGKLVMIRK